MTLMTGTQTEGTMAPLVNQVQLSVVPEINRVKLGSTATFDCDAQLSVADDPIQNFSWVASNLIAKEGRYSFDNNQRTLHVSDIKSYDNNTSVECLVTTDSGGRQAAFGHIVVLPDDTSPLHPRNSTASPTISHARTVSGGLTTVAPADPFDWSTGLILGVVSCAFLLVIFALLVYVWHLKRRNGNRKSWNNDELLAPTITVNNNQSSVIYDGDFDNVSVQYAKPQKSRSVSNLSMMSSIFQYDIPRSSSHSPSPDIIPNSSSPSHGKLYKQKRTSHNMPHKGMHHHRSMPSLNVGSRTLSTEGYEDMDSGRLSRASSQISHQYDNLSPSNLSASHNHLGPPSNVGNDQSKPLSQYSNWSVQEPSRGISYENIAESSQSSFQNSQDFAEYQNQPLQRGPSFEIIDDGERDRRRLNYASLHLDDGHDSPVPVQDNTTYAKIRGIIKILRTKRSTRVNIVNH